MSTNPEGDFSDDMNAAFATAAALNVTVDRDIAEVLARDLDHIQAALDKTSRRWAKLYSNGKSRGGQEQFQAACEALAVAQVAVRAGKDLLLGRGPERTQAAMDKWQRMRLVDGDLVGGYLAAPRVPAQAALPPPGRRH
jgi:hypothetical protein